MVLQTIGGKTNFDGGYYQPLNDGSFHVYDMLSQFKGTAQTQASLDAYMRMMRNGTSGATGSGNLTGTGGTSTTPSNYFDSDEFKSFKQLSLDLAQKAEDRDHRLMDRAAIKRNQEYQRNYREASNLFNAGQSISYSPSGQAGGL